MEKIPTGAKVTVGFVGAFILIMLFLWILPFTTISPGERGVVIRLGQVNRVLDSGFHYKAPFVESVAKMDVQTQKEQASAGAASKDLQDVNTVIALNYHVYPDKVAALYQNIGLDYKERIVDPAIQEAVKAATAQYTAEELITHRQEVKEQITNNSPTGFPRTSSPSTRFRLLTLSSLNPSIRRLRPR